MPFDNLEARLDRFFDPGSYDEGRLIARAVDFTALDAERDSRLARMMAELDTLDTEDEPAPALKPQPRPAYWCDPRNDPDVEWAPITRTHYDKCRDACRNLEAERDRLAAREDLSQADQSRLAELPALIELAAAKTSRALKAADTPEQQGRDRIDAWRKTPEGKAARRTVRTTENEDLSELTDAQKRARKSEQRYESNLRRNLEKEGLAPAEIAARVAEGLARRRAKAANDNHNPAEAA